MVKCIVSWDFIKYVWRVYCKDMNETEINYKLIILKLNENIEMNITFNYVIETCFAKFSQTCYISGRN